MKKLKTFIPLILPLCLFTISLSAEAKGAGQKNVTVYYEINLENGESVLLSGDGIMVDTPSSVFLKTYKFKLTEDTLAQIDFGYFANRIYGVRLTLSTGEKLIGIGFLNKAGILTFTVHKNGAGDYFPKGWF